MIPRQRTRKEDSYWGMPPLKGSLTFKDGPGKPKNSIKMREQRRRLEEAATCLRPSRNPVPAETNSEGDLSVELTSGPPKEHISWLTLGEARLPSLLLSPSGGNGLGVMALSTVSVVSIAGAVDTPNIQIDTMVIFCGADGQQTKFDEFVPP
ncbi:hypothetical protein EKO27_g27 [Xylaria grammica]|uniref:Uncharacterized protein n=1 Tax=Xylaria grammica TaxID=363999 RepID=A0A439DKP9_9PEZI|nr:hypothetical protein EKO27_g27 [Xylaria grammica]